MIADELLFDLGHAIVMDGLSEIQARIMVDLCPTPQLAADTRVCPVCHVSGEQKCVTRLGNPATKPHKGRFPNGE